MDVSERFELLHEVAETLRSGGDIDINPQGQLELRSAGITEKFFQKMSNLTGKESKHKFKISENALPEVSNLVSKVIGELDNKSTQLQQDFKDVRAHLVQIYFGHSFNQPWDELIGNMPDDSPSITLTSFAQLQRSLSHEFEDIKIPPRAHEISHFNHRQYADLFTQLVQEAIKEGEKGRYHVEYALILEAENLMIGYYSAAMDFETPLNTLNTELTAYHKYALENRKLILAWDDSFYSMFGALRGEQVWNANKALIHLQTARTLALNEPQIQLSGIFDELKPHTIKSTITLLEALPKQTPAILRIRFQLYAALHLQTFSSIKFDQNNLSNTWTKLIFVRLLETRIQFYQDRASHHHLRVAVHYQTLLSNIGELKNQMTTIEALENSFTKAPSSPASSQNLKKLQENHNHLIQKLAEAESVLDLFIQHLKEKEIDPNTLPLPDEKYFSKEISLSFENLIYPKFQTSSEKELDQHVDNLRKARQFLIQRIKDLNEILPDPDADLFD